MTEVIEVTVPVQHEKKTLIRNEKLGNFHLGSDYIIPGAVTLRFNHIKAGHSELLTSLSNDGIAWYTTWNSLRLANVNGQSGIFDSKGSVTIDWWDTAKVNYYDWFQQYEYGRLYLTLKLLRPGNSHG